MTKQFNYKALTLCLSLYTTKTWCIPMTISIQKPADGMYKTLSATTNPTRKNKFDAGRNGTTINVRLINSILEIIAIHT